VSVVAATLWLIARENVAQDIAATRLHFSMIISSGSFFPLGDSVVENMDDLHPFRLRSACDRGAAEDRVAGNPG
jgi:hypothetical protein